MCVCAFSSGKIFCKAHCSKSEERFYFFYFYKVARQIFDTGRAMESVIRRGSLVSISIKKKLKRNRDLFASGIESLTRLNSKLLKLRTGRFSI
jgi:hypothetical protein